MTAPRDFQVKPARCPNCGKEIDGAVAVNCERAPEPDDATICLDCGHLCIYAANMSLRDPTDAEIVSMAGDPDLIRAQNAIAEFKRSRAK